MSTLKAVIEGKCPRCREGHIFKTNAYNLSKFYKMHEKCAKCNLRFEREPGFFIGAMYVNYAFTVAIIVMVGVVLAILNLYNFYSLISTIIALVLLLMPYLFRYSRIIYLHMFGGVSYEPDYLKHP